MASLTGCTNVITHRVAHNNGVDIKAMNIRLGRSSTAAA